MWRLRDAGAAGSLPLVCLHGWGMNLAVFDALRDALPDFLLNFSMAFATARA